MATQEGRARLTTEGACHDRHTAVELGNQWHELSCQRARATRAGDAAEAERLRRELRAAEAAIREQYARCQHPPKGDQQRQDKGVEPSVRDEAARTGDRADPELAARMDAAIERANTALDRSRGDMMAAYQAYQQQDRRTRVCRNPTHARARKAAAEPEQPGLNL